MLVAFNIFTFVIRLNLGSSGCLIIEASMLRLLLPGQLSPAKTATTTGVADIDLHHVVDLQLFLEQQSAEEAVLYLNKVQRP